MTGVKIAGMADTLLTACVDPSDEMQSLRALIQAGWPPHSAAVLVHFAMQAAYRRQIEALADVMAEG